MFHFLYSTSQSEVEWALGIISGHIWSGDHLLTMATPIERLNAGKTAPVSNMCAQEKAQHVKYRYFTIPSFRFCCYTAATYAFVVGYSCIANWAVNRQKKLKYGSFPLIEFRYHHILKSGSHRMLSDPGAEWEQAKWKGWHVSLSLPRRIHVLACFCSLATLHNRWMAIDWTSADGDGYGVQSNPCFVKGGDVQISLLQLILRNS